MKHKIIGFSANGDIITHGYTAIQIVMSLHKQHYRHAKPHYLLNYLLNQQYYFSLKGGIHER
jgi:hypothetical protein